MLKKSKSLVLLSGGQDSVTCLLELLKKHNKQDILAMSFIYDAEEKQCIKRAEKICKDLGVEHKIFDYRVLSELSSKHIVSGRNFFFISAAALYAKNNGYDKIYIGLSKDDYESYNDCRAQFIEKMNDTVKYALETKVEIIAPYVHKEKIEIWKIADKLGYLDYVKDNSYSCWKNEQPPCGECLSCKMREDSFNAYKRTKNN